MLDRTKINFLYRWWFSIDRMVVLYIMLLLILGNIFVGMASPVVAARIGAPMNVFITKNLMFSTIAVFIILTLSALDEKQIVTLSVIGFSILVVLLIIVLMCGTVNKGARRWIYIGGFSLQPSEIIKPLFVTLSAFSLTRIKKNENANIVISLLLYILLISLLILQPDIGMLLLISGIFCIQLFLFMIKIKYFVGLGTIACIGLTLLYFIFPHFNGRINTYVNSLFFGGEKSYQTQKSISAFTNGGLLGKGPFEGSVKNYIPDAHTDFIFSVIGEEFGAIMCILIIMIYFYISLRMTLRSLENTNDFKYLASASLSFQFLFQTIINIGVTINLLPTKGMTLPLISYGGSSMIGIAVTLGFLLALNKTTYGNVTSKNSLLIEKCFPSNKKINDEYIL